jgi:hypothetical protein
MKFPHAYKGVKLLFSAQMMLLCTTIIMAISAVVAALTANGSASETALAIAGLISLIAALLTFIAGIISLVGYGKAAKDDKHFGIALALILFSVLASLVSGVLKYLGIKPEIIADILNAVYNLLSELAIIFAILGLCSLSERVGDENNIRYGKSICGVIIAILVIDIVVSVLPIFLNGITATIAVILAVADGVLSFAAYIMYLVYLKKVANMLKK